MYNHNIIELSRENENFRAVLYTGKYAQVVAMCLLPGEDIGSEVHEHDQILVFVQGAGKAVVNGEESVVESGSLVYVPAGAEHNFINTGSSNLKLYTIYSPPEHPDGTVHVTKAESEVHHS